ncbi:glutathione peroxidase [Comamonas composti]|uniref:glutathione peroxidase n=1 Tax=Comamonas composti TaxID=408558 RepID=UPI00047C1DF4|nr:glutathione peroxidase [Comamonas composti]
MTTVCSAYDFKARSITGECVDLCRYRGQALLIVNTASACGFTPQYAGLQALHEQYGGRGLVVLGFPCNQFGAQEQGSEDEIASFCEHNFGVSFALMAKVAVKGKDAHPLYRWLTAQAPGILGTRAIKWNFTKFLTGRDGQVMRRYAPQSKPGNIAADIEKALGRAFATPPAAP